MEYNFHQNHKILETITQTEEKLLFRTLCQLYLIPFLILPDFTYLNNRESLLSTGTEAQEVEEFEWVCCHFYLYQRHQAKEIFFVAPF